MKIAVYLILMQYILTQLNIIILFTCSICCHIGLDFVYIRNEDKIYMYMFAPRNDKCFK